MTTTSPLRPARHRLAVTGLALAAALGLTGCGVGVDAQTNHVYQAAVGTNVHTGQIQIYNALAVDNGDGTATISAVVLNTTDDAQSLDSASATSSSGTSVEVRTGEATVPAHGTFSTGTDATVLLTGDAVKPGRYISLTLTFDGAGPVSIDLPVVVRDETYAEVAEKPAEA